MAKDNGKAGQTDASAKTAPNHKKRNLIFALLALGLVALSVGITLAVVKLTAPDPSAASAAATENAEVKKPAIYYSLKPAFVVNFASEGRQRFLQTDVSLVIRDADVVAALDLHMPAIRNSLVLLFSAQSFAELQTTEGKETLREQALVNVQTVLRQEIGKPGVEQVLFTSFVMQ